MRPTGAAALIGATLLAPIVGAEQVMLTPQKDNTMFEDGPLSNGAGSHLYSGANGIGLIRRGLLAFDVAGAVPAGSTIDAATLTLFCSQTISGPQAVSLRRVSKDWGEGASNSDGLGGGGGGSGAAAAPGDATWVHTFFPGSFWTSQGGDFSATQSAATNVGLDGFYTWGSTPALVADVQAWLDVPGSNFGWVVMGNEGEAITAKRFNSSEHAVVQTRPMLTINFTPQAKGVPGDVNGDRVVNVEDLVAVILAFGPCPPDPCPADVTGDGEVDVQDLVEVILNWTA
jgi:hypothetical protein